MEYLRPNTVENAIAAGSKAGAVYAGGGTRRAGAGKDTPKALISLENLGFGGIDVTGDGWTIGSGASFQDIRDFDGLPGALSAAAGYTASRTMRNMKTVGGELVSRPPGSCLIPVLSALDSEVVLADGSTLAVTAFFDAVDRRDLIREIRISNQGKACLVRAVSRTAHSRKNLVVSVCADFTDGTPRDLRIIASDGVGTIDRLQKSEAAFEGVPISSKSLIEETVSREFNPAADYTASTPYKKYLAAVFTADMLYELAAIGGGK